MEINKTDYAKITSMIQKLDKNLSYEFEARVCNKGSIDYYKFENILNNLIFSKDLGGFGFTNYIVDTTLDIRDNDMRLSINGKDSVKLYWLKEILDDNIDHKFTRKKNIDKIDLDEYNMRISLASEEPLDKKDMIKMQDALKNNSKDKVYRLKNRYYIETPNKMFRFDLTSIKMATGKSFKKSNIFNKLVTYEVELEYIHGNYDNKLIYDNLFNYLNILLLLYSNSDKIIKNSEINEVINKYKDLIKISGSLNNELFITANPVTLQKINLVKGNVPNILENYAVTLKADGIKNLLYVLDSNNKNIHGNIYLIDSMMNIKKTGLNNVNWANTLVEGEYVSTEKLFLAFDILFEKGNDIRGLPLIETKNSRLGYMDLFIKSLKEEEDKLLIRKKEYKYGDNFFEKIKILWDNKNNYEYNVDGLIFAPINEKYPYKGGTWDKLFKWKPPEFNSFDFLVKIDKNENNKDIMSPYIVYRENGENLVYQYKTLTLYVGKLETEYDNKNKKHKKIYKPIEFDPTGDGKYSKANILLDRNEKLMAKDPLINKYTEILDDTIVEFIYDKNKKNFNWIPIRVRHDKTERYKTGEPIYGNNSITAYNVWKNVDDPITFTVLSLGEISRDQIKQEDSYYACQEYDPTKRLPFQNFHNLIVKMNLIKETAPKSGGRLLDIACGKGGDLSKWANAGYNSVVSMDVDKKCIEYAINHYNSYNKPKPEVIYIWANTAKLIFPNQEAAMNPEAKSQIIQQIPAKYSFDVVSCQFCLHYYFENELSLRILLQNINDNLKIGGFFIGTCFDGERVVEALKGKKLLEGKLNDILLWKIEKQYKGSIFNSVKSQFGKNIEVYVNSIGKSYTESLVNFNYLEKMLNEYGFEKVKVTEFGEIYADIENKTNNSAKASKMSDIEKEFSFLNNAFIFKKLSNSPDSLYKKILNLKKK